MDEIKQTAKGDNITQSTIVVQGDYVCGLNREEVVELIQSYGYVNKDEIISIVHEAIEKVPEKQRIAPNKRIFVPLIQQLSYSMDEDILKDTYMKLLSASMDSTKSSKVHPSFINILSQLNADEIKVLNKLPPTIRIPKPLINLRMKWQKNSGLGLTQVKYFSDIGYGICDFPWNIGVYLENLERLKLIDIPMGKTLTNKDSYEKLKHHPDILAVMAQNQSTDEIEITYEFDELFFELTQFGQNFIKCCK